MSWLTPEVLSVIFSVLKAVVIILVVVVCGGCISRLIEKSTQGGDKMDR